MESSDLAQSLKVGWIPYWNLHPFRCELEQLAHSHSFSVRSGIPSDVNAWMKNGELDTAPCSSIHLLNNPNMEIALPLGVAADGPVHSVYLGFSSEHKPLLEILMRRREFLAERANRHIRRLSPDLRAASRAICSEIQDYDRVSLACIPKLNWHSESASSNGLVKLLFNLWFGRDLCHLMIDSDRANILSTCPPVEVVIGDEALKRRNDFYKTWDLGSLWKELTGMPFVYAVWQSRGRELGSWKHKILEAGQKAERRMRVDSSHYMPNTLPLDSSGRDLPLAKYWNSIYYCLGPAEMRSLVLFLSLCKSLNICQSGDSILPKLLRWQDLGCKSSSAEIQSSL